MARPAGPVERVVVDTYVAIPQRRVSCHECGSIYIGLKPEVTCPGCKTKLATVDTKAIKKVPTGTWNVFRDRQISNSSIMGERISDGGGSD